MQSSPDVQLKAFKESLIQKGKFDSKRHDDFLLLRFLRARRFDLQKTGTEQDFIILSINRSHVSGGRGMAGKRKCG